MRYVRSDRQALGSFRYHQFFPTVAETAAASQPLVNCRAALTGASVPHPGQWVRSFR